LQRVLSTVVLMGLLFATAAAFAITEHFKLVKAPLTGAQVTRYFSPVCGCSTKAALVSVELRHADVVTVQIVDARNHPVATLAANESEPRGRVGFAWHGQTDGGGRAPDGSYWPEIHLVNAHWRILLPNRIVLDTHAPTVRSAVERPHVLSPGVGGRGNHLRIAYRLSERAHLIVWHGTRRLLRTRADKPDGKASWNGKTGGKAWRAGTYTLEVGAIDLAGNVTPPAERKTLVVTIRYIGLARRRLTVRAGSRFEIGVRANARYTWAFAHRHGRSARPELHLRAPAKRGRYRLVVRESGHSASARIVVK
jgi:FlgD Ig-like domain